PCAGATAFMLVARGDGREYRLTLRTEPRVDAPQYQAPFRPGAAWAEHRLALAAFEPRFRGRPVPGAPPLEPARVAILGILIGARQAGPFRLELARLEAV
ncbi:MAG: CIA30 family protein, partial [Proteobacteria bacterium]|nr:CIA30 family protein [Pseudomonadota bacterium]